MGLKLVLFEKMDFRHRQKYDPCLAKSWSVTQVAVKYKTKNSKVPRILGIDAKQENCLLKGTLQVLSGKSSLNFVGNPVWILPSGTISKEFQFDGTKRIFRKNVSTYLLKTM